MFYVLFLGCRETHYQKADLKRITGLTYLSKLCLTSPVSFVRVGKNIFVLLHVCMFCYSVLCSFFHPSLWMDPSGAAPMPGVDTVAGRLQECEALSQVSGSVSVLPCAHHQTIKITLQAINYLVALTPLGLYCLILSENHLKLLVNRTLWEKIIHPHFGISAQGTVDSGKQLILWIWHLPISL